MPPSGARAAMAVRPGQALLTMGAAGSGHMATSSRVPGQTWHGVCWETQQEQGDVTACHTLPSASHESPLLPRETCACPLLGAAWNSCAMASGPKSRLSRATSCPLDQSFMTRKASWWLLPCPVSTAGKDRVSPVTLLMGVGAPHSRPRRRRGGDCACVGPCCGAEQVSSLFATAEKA